MIVSLHMATGAAFGAALGSRLSAVALGPLLHMAGDRMPHEDVHSRPFEAASGTAAVALLALARGPLDPAVAGAVAAAVPDLEHRVRLPRPGGKKLFPSHRWAGWHRAGGLPANVQLVVAGVVLGALVAGGRRITERSEATPRRARRLARRSPRSSGP